MMLADASNHELDKINALAQHARDQKGELGKHRVPLKDRPYALAAGDRVIFTASHPKPGQRRVENGTIGTIRHAGKDGRLIIHTSGLNPRQVRVDPPVPKHEARLRPARLQGPRCRQRRLCGHYHL
jgi:hypothetical protein